ncbi:MAG: c-type cytochrome [Myxococcota bacterium]
MHVRCVRLPKGALSWVLAGMVLTLVASPSLSEEGKALDGARLYAEKTCIACHGPDAKSPILPSYPKLAGQNPEYALQQMKDIKSGARNNGNTPAMAGVMHLVDEAEMKALATYIASLEP